MNHHHIRAFNECTTQNALNQGSRSNRLHPTILANPIPKVKNQAVQKIECMETMGRQTDGHDRFYYFLAVTRPAIKIRTKPRRYDASICRVLSTKSAVSRLQTLISPSSLICESDSIPVAVSKSPPSPCPPSSRHGADGSAA